MLRVVLPIAMPGVLSTGIYIFITAWNEFLYAAILTNSNVRTIPVALQNMIGEYQIEGLIDCRRSDKRASGDRAIFLHPTATNLRHDRRVYERLL